MLFGLLAVSGLIEARADESCPTTAAAIATDRPDVTNSSVVVPQGSVQVENGVNLTTRRDSTVLDGTNTRLRLGIGRCTEVLFDLPNYTHALHGAGSAGFSDIVPAIKTQLGPLPGDIELAAAAGLGLPTGAAAVSGHGLEPYLQFPWSHELGRGWSIEGMLTAFFYPGEPGDRLLLEHTFSVEREVGPRADLFLEYVGDYPSHAGPSQILNFGGAYRLTPRQQVDFHAGIGIESRAPTSFVGIGYSFRWDGPG